MHFDLVFTDDADASLELLKSPDQAAQLKSVRKCLGYLETNTRHPSLRSKPYKSLVGPNGEKVFESYAQQK